MRNVKTIYSDKCVDFILNRCMDLFDTDFYLPVVWERREFAGNQIAEWGNMMVTEEMGMFHMISVDFRKIKNDVDLHETFIHELVHAWQYEGNLPVDHGEHFLEKCCYFADLGWNILSEECDLKTLIEMQRDREPVKA